MLIFERTGAQTVSRPLGATVNMIHYIISSRLMALYDENRGKTDGDS